MFCKNCGAQLNQNQAICLNCGVAVGAGISFCQNCGAQLSPGAAVCLNCGVATSGSSVKIPGAKSKIAAGLLAIFLGQLGIHNFYLGYTNKAVAQLLITLLLSWTFIAPIAIWVWAIVEAIKIFQGNLPDSNGIPLSD